MALLAHPVHQAFTTLDLSLAKSDQAFTTLDLSLAKSAVQQPFTALERDEHRKRFDHLDIDHTGFITAADLRQILHALGLAEVTDAQCVNMIAEVGIILGHDNDGRLSFSDYLHLMEYEAKRLAARDLEEAAEEERLSLREEDEPHEHETGRECDGEAPAEAPATRLRGSSFAVMDALAGSRIKAFEQLVAASATEQAAAAAPLSKFGVKLAKFKRIESGEAPALAANREAAHMTSLRAKLVAFEAANKKDPVAVKKSWKNVRQGTWRQKTVIAGGVAPKKTLADLP